MIAYESNMHLNQQNSLSFFKNYMLKLLQDYQSIAVIIKLCGYIYTMYMYVFCVVIMT